MSYLPPTKMYAYLINNTGETSVKGKIVVADSTNGQVVLSGVDSLDPIGIIDEAGVTNGSSMRIVIGGVTEVLLDDNTGSTSGYWAGTSEAGYAQSLASPPGAVLAHFQEIGHFIETVAAGGEGTHVLARLIMHFN